MKIEEIVFWGLFGLGILAVLWLIFGDSPTLEQVLLVSILTMVVKNSVDIKGLKSDVKHSKKSFHALARDFKEHVKHE